jgi:hypothetical protein
LLLLVNNMQRVQIIFTAESRPKTLNVEDICLGSRIISSDGLE